MNNETKIKFEKSTVPSTFTINIIGNGPLRWDEHRTAAFYQVVFTTFAKILVSRRNGKTDTGFILKDDKGEFKFGAKLIYQEPEEGADDDTGNFYLLFTNNPEDMNDCQNIIDNHHMVFTTTAKESALDLMGGRYGSTEIMNRMFNTAIDTLYTYLDKNVNEEKDVHEIILDGVFTASATIENGEKVFSIIPGDYIKQLIKDDKAISI